MRAIATANYETAENSSGVSYDTPNAWQEVPIDSISSDLNDLVDIASNQLTVQQSGYYIVSGFSSFIEEDA